MDTSPILILGRGIGKNGFVTLLVLRLACLSDVKVVFWHVSEHVNLQYPFHGTI